MIYACQYQTDDVTAEYAHFSFHDIDDENVAKLDVRDVVRPLKLQDLGLTLIENSMDDSVMARWDCC